VSPHAWPCGLCLDAHDTREVADRHTFGAEQIWIPKQTPTKRERKRKQDRDRD
jgi:hypothetical protein